jgi:hypothetical protein
MQVTVCWQEFSEAKILYDPVMTADFAAPESKASARSRGDIALQFDLVSQEYLYYNNC